MNNQCNTVCIDALSAQNNVFYFRSKGNLTAESVSSIV